MVQPRASIGRPRRDRLTPAERWAVAAAALAPVGVAAAVLTPIGIATSSSVGDVVVAAVVYGGLVGLASGFVAVDRVQARQCPRCTTRNPRRTPACTSCGYDLVRRPRYACSERHEIHLAPGMCDCGRRVEELEVARGVGTEVRLVLRAGAWLLGFLVVVGLLLRTVSG